MKLLLGLAAALTLALAPALPARAADIPVVGVTETAPPGRSYQAWMMSALDATEKALAGPSL